MNMQRCWRDIVQSTGGWLLSLVLVGLCSAAHADPLVWKIKGKHNSVYLMGTVHLRVPDQRIPTNIIMAYQRSQQLWLEVDLATHTPEALSDMVMNNGQLPADASLTNLLPAQEAELLNTTAQRYEIDINQLTRYQPWLAALVLHGSAYAADGYSARNGIDQLLARQAYKDGKPVHGLETPAEQLAFFTDLDMPQQTRLLQQTLYALNEPTLDLSQLQRAWMAGNEAELEQRLQLVQRSNPELFIPLTTERNQRWLATLQRLLNQEHHTILIAVGALHLVGDSGLVALLRKAGYRPQRVYSNFE